MGSVMAKCTFKRIQARIANSVLFVFLLTGCADQQMRWVRVDGHPIREDPALLKQAEIDRAVCRGEMAKADSASVAPVSRRMQADDDVMTGCMAQKGYLLRPAP
jgi:hypothetical protein